MENPTSRKVGKLYAFFLEVSKKIVHFILHEEQKVPEQGHKMYEQLVKWLAGGNKTLYKRKIMNNQNISWKQKEILTPQNQTIDTASLDFSMYVTIMNLLKIKKGVIPFMIDTRNDLCHYSVALLEQNMTEEDFVEKWYIIAIKLELYGLDRNFLDWCWSVINDQQ